MYIKHQYEETWKNVDLQNIRKTINVLDSSDGNRTTSNRESPLDIMVCRFSIKVFYNYSISYLLGFVKPFVV